MPNSGESGIIDREGFELRYRIEGKGKPTLNIGSSVFYPRSFSQNLRHHLRLIFSDWRGFAKSPTHFNSNQITFDSLLDDIELIRKKLDLKDIMIMGHSAHALMALEYAKKYPDYVSHVVMIGISPNLSPELAKAAEQNWQESIWPERKLEFDKRFKALPDEKLEKFPPDERFVKWYVRQDPKAWYDFQFDSSSLWEGVVPNVPLIDFLYGKVLKDLDISKGLDRFDKPVFLALGRFDFILAPPSSWDPLRNKFKDLTVRVFEHSGHSPQYEEPELFDKELLNWLSQSNF